MSAQFTSSGREGGEHVSLLHAEKQVDEVQFIILYNYISDITWVGI